MRLNLKNEFTEIECERFRRDCNFTDDERAVFDLRVKVCLLVEIQQKLNMSGSTVDRRIKNIKRKIQRVDKYSETNF